MLSYIQNKLAIAYRTRLSKEVMDLYLGEDGDEDKVFYKMGQCWQKPMTCRRRHDTHKIGLYF